MEKVHNRACAGVIKAFDVVSVPIPQWSYNFQLSVLVL